MKLSRFAPLAVALTLSAALPAATFAQAAPAAAQKIVSANMQRIFTDAQEKKDVEAKFKAKAQDAQTAVQNGQNRVRDLQGKRDQFKPGSPDYEKAHEELTRAAAEVQVATAVSQQDLIREQKRSTRTMVDKIVAAVETLAKEKGYSIVLMQMVPPDLAEDQFDRMTPDQLNQLLSSRNVMYVAPDVDVTAEVVARLDAAYKSGK